MIDSMASLDALVARIRKRLEGEIPTAMIDEIQSLLERFFAAFQIIPERDFEEHLTALRSLEKLVEDLEERVLRLEGGSNEGSDRETSP